MTWNIKSGSNGNMNGSKADLDKLVAVIQQQNPDIVVLQEVQVNNPAPDAGGLNQPVYLAVHGGYAHSKFGKAFDWSCTGGSGQYGVAVLSKFFMDGDATIPLNGHTCPFKDAANTYHEPRVLFMTNVHVSPNHIIRVGVTHLSPNGEQPGEMDVVMNSFNGLGTQKTTSILMGDLNAVYNPAPSTTYWKATVGSGLTDAYATGNWGTGETVLENGLAKRIDFIMLGPSYLNPPPTNVHRTLLVAVTNESDHNAVIADVTLP